MSTLQHKAIRNNISLKPFNTFQLDVKARYWTEIHQPDDLLRVMETSVFQREPRFILGGGSNVLFSQDFPGLVIRNSIPGISRISGNERHVVLRAGAGVVWDDLVRDTLTKGWAGLENLSMIPGQTGAAPIQNIGAYGVELESVFVTLDAIDLKTGKTVQFDRQMCRFGYRDSIFKSSHKDHYLITHVTLKLNKFPELNLEYGNLKEVLEDDGIGHPDIMDVSRTVRKIRSSKLPDPAVTGNAGSFFKNPVVSEEKFEKLKEIHPEIPSYPAGHQIKIPAAWLIDKCGFKGKRIGDAGVHDRHALILVNHGNATGMDLIRLAKMIQQEVQQHFGVALEPEVNIV